MSKSNEASDCLNAWSYDFSNPQKQNRANNERKVVSCDRTFTYAVTLQMKIPIIKFLYFLLFRQRYAESCSLSSSIRH